MFEKKHNMFEEMTSNEICPTVSIEKADNGWIVHLGYRKNRVYKTLKEAFSEIEEYYKEDKEKEE